MKNLNLLGNHLDFAKTLDFLKKSLKFLKIFNNRSAFEAKTAEIVVSAKRKPIKTLEEAAKIEKSLKLKKPAEKLEETAVKSLKKEEIPIISSQNPDFRSKKSENSSKIPSLSSKAIVKIEKVSQKRDFRLKNAEKIKDVLSQGSQKISLWD